MRIPLSCWDCSWAEIAAEEAADKAAISRGEEPPKRPPARPLNPDNWYFADIEEDNAYVGKCRNGHEMKMTLQNVRYELLFESGIVAMLIGFHREAVSSIAAALERFYEFALEVFTSRAGIDPADYDAAWKHVKKQSERQFGAFLMLFLTNFKKPFLVGGALGAYEKKVTFRNEAIHQGRFPSGDETKQYARYVFELIRDTRAALKEFDAEMLQKIELRHIFRGHAAVEQKAGPPKQGPDGLYRGASSGSMPMMLNTIVKDEPQDFDSRLARSKGLLWWWGFPNELADRSGL
jgi:hypothetical protein